MPSIPAHDPRMNPPLKAFQKILGHRFRRPAALERALTHPSLRNERGLESTPDNQRLEFLGDAVLGLLAARYLHQLPEELDEGTMTKYRSLLTNRGTLAQIGEQWGLGPLLRLGKGEASSGGAHKDSNLADAVEALLGAVYIDGGLKASEKVFSLHFLPRLERLRGEGADADNPKGALQEFTQRHWQRSPTYRILGEEGPAHDRLFLAAVLWEGREIATGRAPSKRAAEARAAAAALPLLQQTLPSPPP